MKACHMCLNARIDDELTDDTDFSYFSIGTTIDNTNRMMLASGDGKPLRLIVEEWDTKNKQWYTIGIYYPKYCPNCGREIVEYGKG